MKEIIKKILAVILVLAKIAGGTYVLYYLIMNINNPTEYNLSKIQWFFYYFIWDIWVHIHSDKLVVEENNSNE
jgi:hypothetical protein